MVWLRFFIQLDHAIIPIMTGSISFPTALYRWRKNKWIPQSIALSSTPWPPGPASNLFSPFTRPRTLASEMPVSLEWKTLPISRRQMPNFYRVDIIGVVVVGVVVGVVDVFTKSRFDHVFAKQLRFKGMQSKRTQLWSQLFPNVFSFLGYKMN